MPELPEVETFVQKLREWVPVGSVITNPISVFRFGKGKQRYLPDGEKDKLFGSEIQSIERHGKMILFRMDDGLMLCHNAMSGFWDTSEDHWTFDYVEGKRVSTDKDVRVWMRIDLGGYFKTLRFHDTRKFGSLRFYENFQTVPALEKLGPEAIQTDCSIGPAITRSIFEAKMKVSTKSVKETLMDQSFVAGIGNIYSSEICHDACVDPRVLGFQLESKQLGWLFESMQATLELAIHCKLAYGDYLRVYREKSCNDCGKKISSVKLAGRSTYFCTHCQPSDLGEPNVAG